MKVRRSCTSFLCTHGCSPFWHPFSLARGLLMFMPCRCPKEPFFYRSPARCFFQTPSRLVGVHFGRSQGPTRKHVTQHRDMEGSGVLRGQRWVRLDEKFLQCSKLSRTLATWMAVQLLRGIHLSIVLRRLSEDRVEHQDVPLQP